MSFSCQSSFGPSFGHCLSKPLSFDTPVRSGPRHWGQSAIELRFWATPENDAAEKHKQTAAILFSNCNFTTVPPDKLGNLTSLGLTIGFVKWFLSDLKWRCWTHGPDVRADKRIFH